MKAPRRWFLAAGGALLSAACSGDQAPLDPAGRDASLIASLWWIFFWITAAVYLTVMLFVAVAAFRRRREVREGGERRLGIAVGGATLLTVAILFVLLVSSITTGRALGALDHAPRLRIEVTAQQWWWNIEYKDEEEPWKEITTANEIVVPVGQPVELVLRSRDVIHSLWVPNIHGKRDLIPGRANSFVIRADRAGRFDGQCAEFCGAQHARMRLEFIALTPAEFASWEASQRLEAPPPRTPAEQRGQEVFLGASCPLCHTVRGTPARGTNGPDLTHLASRRMIAANSIPNTRGHLAGWILDSQAIKPGNHMPPNALAGEDVQALLAWLGSLK